ncbi:MAG TPA: sugar ABC transporter permease [Chloroflexota bacterium]|nr:sugar ABC transporter permease [Chloroflexota bacterium]
MSSVSSPASRAARVTARRGKSSIGRQEAVIAYLFLAPWIVGFVVFVAGPIIASLGLSLSTYDIVKPPEFIGLDNYVRAFTKDPLFWPSIFRTFEYALVIVPVGVGGALLVALLLNQSLRFTNIYRTVFFLPHLTPVVAAVFIWTWLLQPQYGFVNEVLFRLFHTIGPGWFLAKEWAIPSLILVALWGTIGGNMMMIFLAGLQGVPKDLYDVASIDGAGPWQRFISITLPMLSPTLFFNTVLAIIGALQTFTTAFIATQGGPAYASWFYALHIYTTAFSFGEYGYAAALAWLFFAVLVGFTFVQFRASTRWVYYASEVE